MSNHFSDPNLAPDSLKQIFDTAPPEVGATGRYPEGKLGGYDEGEIAFAVAADNGSKKVLINFGKPVAFLGMSRECAIELAHLLVQKAMEIDR